MKFESDLEDLSRSSIIFKQNFSCLDVRILTSEVGPRTKRVNYL